MDSTDSIFPLVFFLLRSFLNFCILTLNIIERVDVLGVCGKVLVAGVRIWGGPYGKRLGAALCCTQPFPAGFTMDSPQTKAEPISKVDDTSVHLKRGKRCQSRRKI